jgi:hypothetical protein
MSEDAVFILIGFIVNAGIILYVAYLQRQLLRTVNASAREITAIHHETNDMRDQLEKAARAEGKLEGIAAEVERRK